LLLNSLQEQAKKLQDALARKNGDAPLPVDDDPVGRRGRKKSKKSKNSRHQKPTEEVVEDEQEKKVKLPPAVVAEQRYGEDRKEILDKVADSLQEGLKRAKELAKLERKAQKEKEKKSVWYATLRLYQRLCFTCGLTCSQLLLVSFISFTGAMTILVCPYLTMKRAEKRVSPNMTVTALDRMRRLIQSQKATTMPLVT
jgi:hypothetical protein